MAVEVVFCQWSRWSSEGQYQFRLEPWPNWGESKSGSIGKDTSIWHKFALFTSFLSRLLLSRGTQWRHRKEERERRHMAALPYNYLVYPPSSIWKHWNLNTCMYCRAFSYANEPVSSIPLVCSAFIYFMSHFHVISCLSIVQFHCACCPSTYHWYEVAPFETGWRLSVINDPISIVSLMIWM